MGGDFKKHQTRGRFHASRGPVEDGRQWWDLVDTLDGYCVTFFTRVEAEDAAKFARAYVKKWGDIDLGSFPYSLDTPLSYCDDRYPQDDIEAYMPRPWPISEGKPL